MERSRRGGSAIGAERSSIELVMVVCKHRTTARSVDMTCALSASISKRFDLLFGLLSAEMLFVLISGRPDNQGTRGQCRCSHWQHR
jgi:hypothetical protein